LVKRYLYSHSVFIWAMVRDAVYGRGSMTT